MHTYSYERGSPATSNIDRREFLLAIGATAGLVAVEPSPLGATPPRVRVVGLKADYLDRPVGLENRHPRLSWRLESDERNVRQRAYRILVASSRSGAPSWTRRSVGQWQDQLEKIVRDSLPRPGAHIAPAVLVVRANMG